MADDGAVRRFHPEHTWARRDGDLVTVGISDFAQAELSDVVFVELPQPGATVTQGEVFGEAESNKTVSDLYAPLSGQVVEVNDDLEEAPHLVNESPYDRGWLLRLKVADEAGWDALLDERDYVERHTTG
jgi:glycine cleavage system H protein